MIDTSNERIAQAYPLQWPEKYPRTRTRSSSRFKVNTFGSHRDKLLHQVELLVGRYLPPHKRPVLSTNIELRKDGVPYANRRQPDDPGVALYFIKDDNPICICCDAWAKIEENVRAIDLTIDAMRGLDRWGCSDMLNRIFTGFEALPQHASGRTWWDVLGVGPSASLAEIHRGFRQKLHDAHPDRGGSNEAVHELQEAKEQAMKARSL